jgi:hypothetical protein
MFISVEQIKEKKKRKKSTLLIDVDSFLTNEFENRNSEFNLFSLNSTKKEKFYELLFAWIQI